MKKIFSSNPNRIDPLGSPEQLSPEAKRTIVQHIEASNDPFADFVIASAKKIVEQPKPAGQPKPKTNRNLPTRPGLAY